jgi:hypothetical protein
MMLRMARTTIPVDSTVSLWPEAAKAIGASKATAYDVLAPSGWLCDGVPILRVGGRWRVPRASLLRALGLDDSPADSLDESA